MGRSPCPTSNCSTNRMLPFFTTYGGLIRGVQLVASILYNPTHKRQSTLTVPREFTIWVSGRVLASEKSKTDSGRAAGAKNAIKTLKSIHHRFQNLILVYHPPRFWSPQNVLLLAILFVRYAGLPILNFDFVPHSGNRVHTHLTKIKNFKLYLLLEEISDEKSATVSL